MRRRLLAGLLVAVGLTSMCFQSAAVQADGSGTAGSDITLTKSNSGNPMLGFDENGDILYGGDPSILVDGDTVYAYVGHDTSSNESYYMPDWRCYSSTDMKNWKYESQIMSAGDISWAKDNYEAWAGQVMKHNGKYYFYYCTEANSANKGGKSIGVAVSDSPTGPFEDIGKPLVRNVDTTNSVHSWEDIDPTAWIETDAEGVEHRYLGWGNTRFFIAELNEDMISITDRDGNPNSLSCGYASDYKGDAEGYDIVVGKINNMPKPEGNDGYTEAPWYYRQQDENGNYYGPYYMFYAYGWREQMAYATIPADGDIMSNEWEWGGLLMEPSATANTNHMAVFDFKGQTYFVYHDGSLPHGSGYRRVTCVEPLTINEDGSIDYIKKTAVGLTGTVSKITDDDGNYLAHKAFENTQSDSQYPMTGKAVECNFYNDGDESEWEIVPAMHSDYKNQDAYVSIESNNKPGMYLASSGSKSNMKLVLSQNVNGTNAEALAMTFHTVKGLSGSGVSFESVVNEGYYLISKDGKLTFTNEPDAKEATFHVSTDNAVTSGGAYKTKRMYAVGDELKTDDIKVQIYREDHTFVTVDDVTVDASKVDMSKAGTYDLTVSYEYQGETCTDTIQINVVDAEYFK